MATSEIPPLAAADSKGSAVPENFVSNGMNCNPRCSLCNRSSPPNKTTLWPHCLYHEQRITLSSKRNKDTSQESDARSCDEVFVSPPSSTPLTQSSPLRGFDSLDPVQCYAVGALAVVLLHRHATDLNGIAFARTQSLSILEALRLRYGQQEALLALNPSKSNRDVVVAQCVQLVGELPDRFLALQAMLALAVASGTYDARSRAFLTIVADHFEIPWPAVAAVEVAVAVHLLEEHPAYDFHLNDPSEASIGIDSPPDFDSRQDDEKTFVEHSSVNSASPEIIELSSASNDHTSSIFGARAPDRRTPSVDQLLILHRKKKQRMRKAMKIGGITVIGGMLFGLTGGLIAPALLSALAGVGVASAAGLAASGSLTSGAIVGGLFGVAGGGFTLRKARHRVSTNLDEFVFEWPDDPRVIEGRKRKARREREKMEKLAQRLTLVEATSSGLIDGVCSERPLAHETGQASVDGENKVARSLNSQSGSDGNDTVKEDNFAMREKGVNGVSKFDDRCGPLKLDSQGVESAANVPSLDICICVPAWLTDRAFGSSLDQFEPALKTVLPCSQHVALRWESKRLYEMGLAFAKFWASKATVTTVQQAYPHALAAASSVAGAVAFAFAVPLTVMSCMDYIDNPWSILVSRSNGAGEELADVLVERSYGNRPVSLFGYSIGARVVFKCLESLASRGAYGIVENVFLMGAAVTADPERWNKIRPVVAGRLVNAYVSYDWALAFFHRGCGHGLYVSGLRRVEEGGVENLNMAYLGIEGHRELKDSVPRVMRAMGVGLGYITMPPAKLILKRDFPSDEDADDLAVVREEAGNEKWVPELNQSLSENGENSMHHSLWISEPVDKLDSLKLQRQTRKEETVTDFETCSKQSNDDDNSRENNRANAKSRKSRRWFPWSRRHEKTSKSRQKVTKQNQTPNHGIEAVDFEGTKTNAVHALHDDTTSDVSAERREITWEEKCLRAENIDTGLHATHEQKSNDNRDMFDWEKQRRIWAKQELLIQERGITNAMKLDGIRGRMMLNISIEVAGRRLERFIDQDAELPVDRKEEVFTNCVDDQRGMQVRVFEHEEKHKSLPCNMLKREAIYPKQIAEMELRLKEATVKGKLRVVVAIWVDKAGDVHTSAEERLSDGSVGDHKYVSVPRSELCSTHERIQLENAENEQVEIDKEGNF